MPDPGLTHSVGDDCPGGHRTDPMTATKLPPTGDRLPETRLVSRESLAQAILDTGNAPLSTARFISDPIFDALPPTTPSGLESALATALHKWDHADTPFDVRNCAWRNQHESQAAAILSHPAVVAALGASPAETQEPATIEISRIRGRRIVKETIPNPALKRAAAPTPDPALVAPAVEPDALTEARATIEMMSGDAADLTDLMDEAALLRTALGHVLIRTHDSGCGTCDAARALLTHERHAATPPPAPSADEAGQ